MVGGVWQEGVHETGPQQILRETVTEQAVRILLECTLVLLIKFKDSCTCKRFEVMSDVSGS